ncbi:LuxR C-terminal-related transcriptional regulator [Methylobacterium phyllosphaerae]
MSGAARRPHPGLSGLSPIRRSQALEAATRILPSALHDDPMIVARALEGGAQGFVLEDTAMTRFHEAIADSLSMSERSVSAVVSGIQRKLGAGSLADLLHIALSRDGRPV